MSADIKVSFLALQTLSADINRESNEIQAQLDQLESDVNRLQANWDGDAQQAYLRAKSQWDSQMLEIREILTEMSAKVDQAGVQYQATEAKNAARF